MGIAYKKFEPTEYVMKVKKGKVIQKGLGLSFFFNTMTESMTVVPTTAFDASFAFNDIMTSDFQCINVQGDISYIITDYEKASKMVNFSYKDKKEYAEVLKEAKQKMAKRIINLAKVYVTKFISSKNVREAIISADELAGMLKAAMKDDETIQEFGLELISISILGILAQADTRKALEAATREEILKQQDDAIYKRRNAAIEQERIVKENELNTEIKVAEKQKEKREKEMEMKKECYRPNGMILAYPVITSGEFAHRGSFVNLLGNKASDEMEKEVSLENQVTDQVPPVFMWHTFEDGAVPLENSMMFAAVLSELTILTWRTCCFLRK